MLKLSTLRQILYEELAVRLEKFGYVKKEYGLFERKIADDFYHLFGACTLRNPSGFYIMIGVRDEKISDVFTSLYRDAETKHSLSYGNKKPDLITKDSPTMCDNLNYLAKENNWKEWCPPSEDWLHSDIDEAIEIFEEYALPVLEKVQSRADIYEMLKTDDYVPPISISEFQIPLVFAWMGDIDAAKAYIKEVVKNAHPLEKLYWDSLIETNFLLEENIATDLP